MEKKSNLKNVLLVILVFLVGILLIYIGYDKFFNKKVEQNNNSNNQEEVNFSSKEVKTWLENNEKIVMYFIDFGNDFNYLNSKDSNYSNFLAWCLLFFHDTEKKLPYLNGSNYTDEYSLSKKNAEIMINKFLRNDLKGDFEDIIDFSLLKNYNKEYFNFYSDENNYYVQVLATGFDPLYRTVFDDVKLNNKKEIVVRYKIFDYSTENFDQNNDFKYRELLLEKTSDTYRILSSYEVK